MSDPQPQKAVNNGPIIKFPPFPIQPLETIIPFKDFKEHGIRIFSDTGVEMDGLGIPTVELGVVHELDECKTETRRKALKDDGSKVLLGDKRGKIQATTTVEAAVAEKVKLNPMERAKEQRNQRYLLFEKKEWYDQWSEGEHLRGLNTYDPNLPSSTRIHQASTQFRTSRTWPHPHTHLLYLWDQFRLYAGLLRSTPVWTRTDLPQTETLNNDEDENEIDNERPTKSSTRSKENSDDEIDLASDSELEDEFIANINQTKRTNDNAGQCPQNPPPPFPPRKRIPPRTPYALFNKDPIPVSSDAEVHALLARASVEKETKLLTFLNDPEKSVKVFLSSYMRKEGLIWTPSFLTYLPLLLTFFLDFVIRTRALPECERQLKRAVEIAREAATELPRTSRLCRILPDAMGKGAKGCWGPKWEEKWDFGLNETINSKPAEGQEELNKEEALKIFEEEVKQANLQLLSKETIFGPREPLEKISVNQDSDDEEIDIRILSPTSPEAKTPTDALMSQLVNIPQMTEPTESPPHASEKSIRALAPNPPALPDSPPPSPPAQPSSTPILGPAVPLNSKGKEPQISDDESEDSEEDPRSWASPTGRPPTRSQKLAEKAAWFPPPTQPLMGILGMTVLPLRYESGIAERSLRKVIIVLKPGEGGGGGGSNNKWRGVEEELVKRLARVVLSPWPDWDDGGMAPEFKTPTLVGGDGTSAATTGKEGGGNGKSGLIGHDPSKDDITILVEPNVANSLNVGMGMAGTWVQMIPLRSENFGGGRGRGRGGDGGGRGRGRSGGGPGGKEQRFWYVEDLSMAIPSFWTVDEELEAVEADEEDIDNVGRRWLGL